MVVTQSLILTEKRNKAIFCPIMNWLLRVTRSPYLLWVLIGLGTLVGAVVLVAAMRRSSGSSGIDAARIHQIRSEDLTSR